MKTMIKTAYVIGRGLNVSRTPPPSIKKHPTPKKTQNELPRAKTSNNFKNLMLRQIPRKKIDHKKNVSEKNNNNALFDVNNKNEINEKLPREKENCDQYNILYRHCTSSKNSDNLMVDKIAISGHVVDEINNLIKKINLSFNEKKQESSFFISEGIFENAHFKLHCDNNNLDITMLNAQRQAADLMYENQAYLAAQLANKEINLRRLVFG